VGLWDLIWQLGNGYEETFDPLFKALSEKVRSSYAGKVLRTKLAAAKSIAIGKPFPVVALPGLGAHFVSFRQVAGRSRYTLIDFWFSHCGACIGQFPSLISLYDQYRGKGFGVVGISIDPKEQITAWKAAIKEYKLPWIQCLDIGGKMAGQLSIVAYPTNFLVDGNGVIVKRDINMEELKEFLGSL
jgi:thiol-disulfide isomerase/thioredoxin